MVIHLKKKKPYSNDHLIVYTDLYCFYILVCEFYILKLWLDLPDFKCTSWYEHEQFGHTRDVSFQHPIKIYLGMDGFPMIAVGVLSSPTFGHQYLLNYTCITHKVQSLAIVRKSRNFEPTETGTIAYIYFLAICIDDIIAFYYQLSNSTTSMLNAYWLHVSPLTSWKFYCLPATWLLRRHNKFMMYHMGITFVLRYHILAKC